MGCLKRCQHLQESGHRVEEVVQLSLELGSCYLSQSETCLGIQLRNITMVPLPLWGGFYERLIGVVKMYLKKTLGKACVSFEEFCVLLKEVKVVVNNQRNDW